jgi:hypothetical protein
MFISLEYDTYIKYDEKTNIYKQQCKIIDSDFEQIITARFNHMPGGTIDGLYLNMLPIIEAYEKRNLPIAPNLIKAILYVHKNAYYSISELLDFNKDYNQKFAKYEKDIEKYLILL